jgi:hypothetical protein
MASTERDRVHPETMDDLHRSPDREVPDALMRDAAEGMTVVARTQGQLVRRRFFRHRAAMGGMFTLFLIVVAYSSIGFDWGPLLRRLVGQGLARTGTVIDGGRPTLGRGPGVGHVLGALSLGSPDFYARGENPSGRTTSARTTSPWSCVVPSSPW